MFILYLLGRYCLKMSNLGGRQEKESGEGWGGGVWRGGLKLSVH